MDPAVLLNIEGRKIVLASGSTRRANILTLAGFKFEVQVSAVDEDSEEYTIPENQVLQLSQKKAAKVAETIKDGLVVGADTIVVLDKEVLGKPRNSEHARAMLRRLSGRTHTVYTGLAIMDKATAREAGDYERTQVTFRRLSEQEIEHYVRTKSPLDKAGGYGIQDQGALFVAAINGCFYNVMGFPLAKFYTTLRGLLN